MGLLASGTFGIARESSWASFIFFVFHFFSDYCVLPIQTKCKTSFGIKTDGCQTHIKTHIKTGILISLVSQHIRVFTWYGFLSVLGGWVGDSIKNVQSELMLSQIWYYLILGGWINWSQEFCFFCVCSNWCQAKSAVISFCVHSPEKKIWVSIYIMLNLVLFHSGWVGG